MNDKLSLDNIVDGWLSATFINNTLNGYWYRSKHVLRRLLHDQSLINSFDYSRYINDDIKGLDCSSEENTDCMVNCVMNRLASTYIYVWWKMIEYYTIVHRCIVLRRKNPNFALFVENTTIKGLPNIYPDVYIYIYISVWVFIYLQLVSYGSNTVLALGRECDGEWSATPTAISHLEGHRIQKVSCYPYI